MTFSGVNLSCGLSDKPNAIFARPWWFLHPTEIPKYGHYDRSDSIKCPAILFHRYIEHQSGSSAKGNIARERKRMALFEELSAEIKAMIAKLVLGGRVYNAIEGFQRTFISTGRCLHSNELLLLIEDVRMDNNSEGEEELKYQNRWVSS
jgi:hypothetical protein